MYLAVQNEVFTGGCGDLKASSFKLDVARMRINPAPISSASKWTSSHEGARREYFLLNVVHAQLRIDNGCSKSTHFYFLGLGAVVFMVNINPGP